MNTKSMQEGTTIIEILGALAVGSMLLVGLSAMVDSSMEDIKGQQAASYQSQLVIAAKKYINANFAALIASTAGSTIQSVSITKLQTDNFLSSGFPQTNVYGHAPCVLIRQPVSGKLEAMIASSGGERIPEAQLPFVSMSMGEGGGYISITDPSNARGAQWNTSTTNYRNVPCTTGGPTVLTGTVADGGRLVSGIFHNSHVGDFLYRDDIGRPELNQMNTPIRLANGALVTAGSDCTVNTLPVSGIAVDNVSRDILTCGSNGLWSMPSSSSWKEPVVSYSSLPATGTVGDVRMVTDIGRAFMHSGNVANPWIPLAADQNNNLALNNISAAGDIVADDINAVGNIAAGKGMRAANDIVSDIGIVGRYYMYTEAYHVGGVFNAGGICNYHIGTFQPDGSPTIAYPTGSIVRDINGLLMSCNFNNTFTYANGTYSPN